MDLREFEWSLKRLNKIKKQNKNIYDDNNKPDCKCPYGNIDPKDCEDLCKLNYK